MTPTRSELLRLAGWAVLLASLVHLDWHLGRPLTMRFSLGWPWHWLLGLAAGLLMGRHFVRRYGSRAWQGLVLVGVMGFVLGQLAEPALEVLVFNVTFERVFSPPRWPIFFAFAVAWAGGCAVVLGAAWWFRRKAGG